MAIPIQNWWRNRIPKNSSSNKSGSTPLGSESISAPRTGAFITYSDGSRFRRVTPYSRSRLLMQPGRAENSGYWNFSYTSSPGGNISNWMTANWSFRFQEISLGSIHSAPGFPYMEENEAVTKALNEIADGKAQLGEGLATIGQTVRLFKNPVSGLIKGIKSIHKDNEFRPFFGKSFRQLVREGIPRHVANRYLEYVYGLVPLMQDIHGVSELAKEQLQLGVFLHGRGVAKRLDSLSDVEYRNVSHNQREYYRAPSYKSRTTCHLWARLDPNYQGTRSLNRLGLLNPLSVVWELVPYSFLVDWVLPVGPVLSALTAPAGLLYVNGSLSRRLSINWQWESGGSGAFVNPGYRGTLASGAVSYEGYNRQELTSWPRPGIWFDSDPLRLASDGSDRVFKALALAIARLPRSR